MHGVYGHPRSFSTNDKEEDGQGGAGVFIFIILCLFTAMVVGTENTTTQKAGNSSAIHRFSGLPAAWGYKWVMVENTPAGPRYDWGKPKK